MHGHILNTCFGFLFHLTPQPAQTLRCKVSKLLSPKRTVVRATDRSYLWLSSLLPTITVVRVREV